jgi:hypothetical protein
MHLIVQILIQIFIGRRGALDQSAKPESWAAQRL